MTGTCWSIKKERIIDSQKIRRLPGIEYRLFEFGPSSFTRNSEYDFVQIEGHKNGCLRFFIGFFAKKLDIYLDNNPHKIRFWEKSTLVATYSRELIAFKICRKVTFGQSFNNNH